MNGKSKADSPSTYETPQCRLRKRDYSRSLASEPDVKVSLHPAQASQRPCEGPVSSETTCWLHDTRQTSIPYGEGSTSAEKPPSFATPSLSILPAFSCRDTAGK